MVSKLNCATEILRRHLDVVDVSADFLEGEKSIRLPNGTWLFIELRYEPTSGLTVDRIGENKNVKEGNQATKEYMGDSYVKGLPQKVNDDIKRNC